MSEMEETLIYQWVIHAIIAEKRRYIYIIVYLRLLLKRIRAAHTLNLQSNCCALISCIDWAIGVPTIFGLLELEYCSCAGLRVAFQHRQQPVFPELLEPF